MRQGASFSEAGKLGNLASLQVRQLKHQERLEVYASNPTKCLSCNAALPYSKRRNLYCSSSCSARVNNHQRPSRLVAQCVSCGIKLNKNNNKYCSNQCQRRYLRDTFIQRWLDGLETGIVADGLSVSTYIRYYFIDKYGERCMDCGWCAVNPYTSRVPLNLHHMDGNALNNRPENLRLLCPNCHSLTPSFGNLNKGKGRSARRTKTPL